MKKIFFSLGALLFLLMLFAPALNAQTTTNAMKMYEHAGGVTYRWDDIVVDTVSSVWSQAIDISNYNDYAWTTDGVLYGGKAYTASGNPKIVVDYYICNANPDSTTHWTLGNDSLFTINATTVFNSSTARMNVKADKIKFKLSNLSTGKKVTHLGLGITFYKRDDN